MQRQAVIRAAPAVRTKVNTIADISTSNLLITAPLHSHKHVAYSSYYLSTASMPARTHSGKITDFLKAAKPGTSALSKKASAPAQSSVATPPKSPVKTEKSNQQVETSDSEPSTPEDDFHDDDDRESVEVQPEDQVSGTQTVLWLLLTCLVASSASRHDVPEISCSLWRRQGTNERITH